MKKYIKLSFLIAALLLLWQCKTYYLRSSITDKNPKSCNSETCINLNEYDLFVRKFYTQDLSYNKKNDSLHRTEFQFVFIKGNDVVLITTLPFKDIPNQAELYLIDKDIPNAHYFNNFYFGTVCESEGIKKFTFKNKENTLIWNLSQAKDTLDLLSIDMYKNKTIRKVPKTVLAENFIIKNSLSYKVKYVKNPDYKTINAKCDEPCKNSIKFNNQRKLSYLKKYKNEDIVVKLDLIFTENLNNHYDKMRFNKGRIKYDVENKDNVPHN
ncbi:hypothetical protein LPB90_12055 [Chryseobacterium sp. LC2016-29]|uniref:hypothetical protein n=1 Tax=Chryseobacterium sp. LC2016-29 TaxID=2897331 RepID=UPI001E53F14B|nr:hypothetical protein [Chryseobacterium sp. LC2016-29]MCD0479193.1 hypothetical protein [Chryseobacterium sp. LC2016-29]